MPLAIVHSRGLDGLSAPEVAVEVLLAGGLLGVTLVGLPDTEVKEARDRVRAALQNSGFAFPSVITVNLAPADLPKESGRFDLPIAFGLLAASGQIPGKALSDYEFAGELSLSGELRPIRGALTMVLAAGGGRRFVLPAVSAHEAALAGAGSVLAANNLLEVCAHLSGQGTLAECPVAEMSTAAADSYPDLADVRGQAQAKRALEIAAAGGHSILPVGPPGSGNSMLATRLPGPLLDGIDLQVEVPALPAEALQKAADGESSVAVRCRVALARERQQLLQGKPNARRSSKEVDVHCGPETVGTALLKQAIARLNLSARAYHRVLRVARSIADLAGSAAITPSHIAEAVQYRRSAKD